MTFPRMLSLMLVACSLGAFSQTNPPAAPRNVTEVFDRVAGADERATLALANAMPEERYGFRPTKGAFKGVRNFAQLAKHVAVANYQMGAALLGEKVPVEQGPHDNGPDSVRSKADVVKFLRDSFAYLHKAIGTVNESNLMELVELPEGGRVARLTVVTAALSHPMDIYGQMIEYLRMNGIDPQK
jgi:DinB family protein